MNRSSFPPLTADFLRQIADLAPEGGQAGYTYAASVLLPETGWPEAEFLTRLSRELAQPQNRHSLERAAAARRAGSFAPFTLSLSGRGGKRVNILALPRPATMPDGSSRILTALAPMSLTPSIPFDAGEELFRFLEFFPAYVLLIDREYSVRFSNKTARQIFGPCEGKKCYQLLHGRSSPCISCPPFGLLTDKAIKIHEWVSPQANTAFRTHSYPFVDREGTMLVLQVGINITAGVRAKHALDLSEQRYRSIAENLTMGLALVDADRKIITLNPKMEEWFGPKAAKGTFVDDLLQQRCCADTAEQGGCLFETLLADKKNQERDLTLTLDSGEDRLFRLVACPILTRARRVRAIVILLEDITDRRNLASRLQQMQRLEALGSLAGGIAHEINQPLSALHLYASGMQMLLEQGATTPEQVLERLSLILSQAEKIRQIISHMRALVMQEENPPCSAVHVRDAIRGALGLVGMQMQDHAVRVIVDIPEDLPPVAANAVQLEQVAINLLVNAMHALDSVGQASEPEKRILVTAALMDEKTVAVRFTDNGPGVGRMHSRIFDPFFTTKESHQGMGLGLSIVHAFVTSWGGSVEARDNPHGPGATFLVRLPVHAGNGEQDSIAAGSGPIALP